jgi:SP family general alpha glucoside:H+ symporter-like MFS transporter
MSWSIGGILVAGVTYAYNGRQDEWAWRMPLALQWIFPVSSRPIVVSIPDEY